MNITSIEGSIALMASMTGFTLDRVRPGRKMTFGNPYARAVAVAAPIPPSLGPVMTTRACKLKCSKLRRSWAHMFYLECETRKPLLLLRQLCVDERKP